MKRSFKPLLHGLVLTGILTSHLAFAESGIYSFLDGDGSVYFNASKTDNRYQAIGQNAKADPVPAGSSDIVVLGRPKKQAVASLSTRQALASRQLASATGHAGSRRPARILASRQAKPSRQLALADVPMTAAERRELAARKAALQPHPRLTLARPLLPHQYTRLIAHAAKKQGMDTALVHAVVRVESNFRPTVISPKGAIGLMQLMPGTARQLGVRNPADPMQNLLGGTHYLKSLIDKFGGNLSLALAAYNAGAGNVSRFGNKIPPFKETRNYVTQVMAFYNQFQQAGKHP